jgi:DNA-binding IclR family transcriptional regulator
VAKGGRGGTNSLDRESSRTSVLRRAADLIQSFDDAHLVLSLQELSTRAGLPKSTTHRFAEQLIELGWLEPTLGGYHLGIRLFEVGGLVERRNRLRDCALPYMYRLAERFECVVHLGILDSNGVLCIEKVPVQGFEAPTREGGRMPVHCTAMGKVLLAFSNSDIEAAIERGLPSFTGATIVGPQAFRDELTEVTKTGIAFDREEHVSGFSCVGAPIRNSGRAIGAISLTVRSDAFKSKGMPEAAKRTADEIWRDLFKVPVHGSR